MRTPGLSLALLLTIALGIGSNVSVLGFVRGLTRPDSPLASVDRIVSIFGQDAHREAGTLSYRDYLSLRSHLDKFEWLGAARVSPGTVSLAGQSSIMSVAALTPDVAGVLNLSFEGGAIVSDRVWQNEFRARPDVRGEHVRIDGVETRVSGVAPGWLEGLYRDRPVDIWMPFDESGSLVDHNVWAIGRLRRGVSNEQLPAGLRVTPYIGMTPEVAAGFSRIGTLLSLGAGLVFFIACANVASFLLGRASARAHETSLRVALGASRGQLGRELLSDSIVISVAGGASGILLAVWTSRILPALLFEEDAGHLIFAPGLLSIVAAAAGCIAITIACGLLPILEISYDRPAIVLRRESAGPSAATRRLRVCLVVAQMASCCVLVICTAFLFDGLRAALQTGIARRLGHPILATVEARQFSELKCFREVQQAAQSVPGISPMAWAGRLPGSLPTWQSFHIEPRQLPLRQVTLDIAPFTPDSPARFTVPYGAGRMFGVADQTCRAALANQEAAQVLFGAETPGRSILDPSGFPVEIIGVLAKHGAPGRPAIYFYGANQQPMASAHFRAPPASKLAKVELDSNVVSPGYFAVMGWALVAGRSLPDESMPRECRVAVVNQEASDLYFAGNAVGAAVIDDQGQRTAIVGVVHSSPLGTFERRAEPAIYFPMAQDCLRRMTLLLSAREANAQIMDALRSRIDAVPTRGPHPPVLKTLETYLSQTALSPLRIATLIIGASTATALALSILGLFGALSDAARQRRRELAVRIALGAQRRHVVGLVLRDGGRLACAGILAGTLGSLVLSRLLSRISPGHGLPALWVWLAAPLVLAGAVMIASVLPARRAMIVNPLIIMGDNN